MLALLTALWAAMVGPGPSDLDVGRVDRAAAVSCVVEAGAVPVLGAPAAPESWRGGRGLAVVDGDETRDGTGDQLAADTSPAHPASSRTLRTRGVRPRPTQVFRRERSLILRC